MAPSLLNSNLEGPMVRIAHLGSCWGLGCFLATACIRLMVAFGILPKKLAGSLRWGSAKEPSALTPTWPPNALVGCLGS